MNKRIRKKYLKKNGLYVNPRDTWSLDYTIAKFVSPRLKLYKKLTIGYPCEFSDISQWYDILDKMIESFDLILNDDGSIDINEYDNWKEIAKEKNNKIQEGLDLFAKYFRGLWW